MGNFAKNLDLGKCVLPLVDFHNKASNPCDFLYYIVDKYWISPFIETKNLPETFI